MPWMFPKACYNLTNTPLCRWRPVQAWQPNLMLKYNNHLNSTHRASRWLSYIASRLSNSFSSLDLLSMCLACCDIFLTTWNLWLETPEYVVCTNILNIKSITINLLSTLLGGGTFNSVWIFNQVLIFVIFCSNSSVTLQLLTNLKFYQIKTYRNYWR